VIADSADSLPRTPEEGFTVVNVPFASWVVEADRDATREAYAATERSLSIGGCGCNGCRNFALHRESLYSPQLLSFFDAVGLDYRKECEIGFPWPDAGRWGYLWWFHFVGRIVSGPECVIDTGDPAKVSRLVNGFCVQQDIGLEVWLSSKRDQAFKVLGVLPLVQVDFVARLEWRLAEPPPAEETRLERNK
jgi:hypothetical protein